MKVLISDNLKKIFLLSHKNPNYSLDFILSSLDLDTCSNSIMLIDEFKLCGDKVELEIDDSNIKRIRKIFGNSESQLIEKLLWVSVMFPEI